MPDDTTDQVVLFVTFQQLDTATTHTTGELYLRKPKRLRPKKRPLTRTEARYKHVSRSATFPPASITKPVWIGPAGAVEEIKVRLAADPYIEPWLNSDPFTVHEVGGITPAHVRRCRAFIAEMLDADDDPTGLEHAIKQACEVAEHAAPPKAASEASVGKGGNKTRKHKTDAGDKVKKEARQRMVIDFLKESRITGTCEEIAAALKSKTGLDVSPTTIWRDIQERFRELPMGKLHVSQKPTGKGKVRGTDHEAVAGSADSAQLECWTMPDDDPIS